MSKTLATIDLGSSSFHLTIVRVDTQRRRRVLLRHKQKVQLRAGLTIDGNLNADMQHTALACLQDFAHLLKRFKVDHVSAIGTYTFRKLTQAELFLKQAETELGYPIQIISGEEEARLIYLGAIAHRTENTRHLVIDIGGGSTELIIGDDKQMLALASLEMGCVSFQQYFFADGQLKEVNFQQAIAAAKTVLQPVLAQYLTLGWEICTGGSGTVKTIAGILHEAGWQTGIISHEGLRYLYNQLLDCGTVEAIKLPGLRADRANILAGGLCILMALFDALGINTLRISKGAIREGILQELIHLVFNTGFMSKLD